MNPRTDASTMDENNSILRWFNEHPTITLGVALFAALIVGGLLMRRKEPTEQLASETDNLGDLSGLETVNGIPVLYRQTQSVFYNISTIEDSYNNPNTTTVNNNQQPSTQPGTPGTPPSPTQPTGWNCSRTVRGGDTLSGIAALYGKSWQELYERNKQNIDAMAAQRGNPIPGGPQNNIFPGQVLIVPC